MDSAYLNKFAISQSSIKDWKELCPQDWHDTWITRTRKRPQRMATNFGSYLDCLMFTPKVLDKRFVISEVAKPSEKVEKILNALFAHVDELNKNALEFNQTEEGKKRPIPLKEHSLEDQKLINKFTEEFDHYKGRLDQAYNDVIKKGSTYFDFLKTTVGKVVITPEEKKIAEELQNILHNDPVSKGFFIPKAGCEVLFQTVMYGSYDVNYDNVQMLPLKGAVDIIHVNNKRKEIREVDLKCTEDAHQFDSPQGPIKRFDYIGQHSFYDNLLRQWIKTYKDGKYKDYTVMNPLNVVIDQYKKVPYLYEYNQNDLYIKRMGIEGTKVKGWEDILNEIAFHIDCQNWTRPMEHIKHGKMLVTAFARK